VRLEKLVSVGLSVVEAHDEHAAAMNDEIAAAARLERSADA
jgi:hypothetical protein